MNKHGSVSTSLERLVGVRVNHRDLDVLQVLLEQGCMRTDDLALLLGRRSGRETSISDRGARAVVGRWRQAGLATTSNVLSGPSVVLPTSMAARLVGWPGKPRLPAFANLRHDLSASALRLQYEGLGWRWTAERVLQLRESNYHHRPDAVVNAGDETPIAVEVELTPKSRERLRGILGDLLDHFASVHYWCSKEAAFATSCAVNETFIAHDASRVEIRTLPAELLR